MSSLCIATLHELKFKKKIVTNIIYPQDSKGNPVYNSSGKYMVKLWFNGAARKVVIDDRFPIDGAGSLVCSFSKDKAELWVSVIEKAYMKLNGGYDFPGSNSGIDLYALTGWLPESVHLRKSSPNDLDKVWRRLIAGSTMATFSLPWRLLRCPKPKRRATVSFPPHAYAVLQVKDVGGHKLMQLRNPWGRVRWRGAFSPYDASNWTPQMERAVGYNRKEALRRDDGIFWIDSASLVKYFDGMYMNWNMKLFKLHTTMHRHWAKSEGPSNDQFNVGYNPQYVLAVDRVPPGKTAIVWLVLTRHVVRKEQILGSDDHSEADFMTLHVYDRRDGKRVYYPQGS